VPEGGVNPPQPGRGQRFFGGVFAKFLLVVAPVFAALAWAGLSVVAHYDVVGSEERLAARLGVLAAFWAAYILALPWVGYLVGTAVLLGGMMWFLGYRRWGVMAAVAIGVPLATFWAFEGLLKVFLPRGVLLP